MNSVISIRHGLILAAFTAVTALLLAALADWTLPWLQQNQRRQLLDSLQQVLPDDQFDNDLSRDCVAPSSVEPFQPQRVYRAYRHGKPSALLYQVRTSEGYSGPIALLVAVDVSGQVLGVRVTEHRETPGLGDRIERQKSDWILGFERASSDWPAADWAVRKDGGQFDQLTGATITSRALVKAVKATLDYHQQAQSALWQAPNDCS